MEKYFMTWNEVYQRVHRMLEGIHCNPSTKMYGVPRGGIIPAALTRMACETPEVADYFVDDIIDSGRTREKYINKYHHPFLALVNKQEEDVDLGWVVFPWEFQQMETGPEDAVVRILEYIGEDTKRDGLKDTPRRVLKALEEMTSGYKRKPCDILSTQFDVAYDEMVVLRGIRFSSLCEHHLLPFTGEAAVGYIPGRKVVGISKLARLVQCFSQRLQVQERLTVQVAEAIRDNLEALGVGVVIKAHHQCMGCRGVLQPDTEMITSCLLGVMLDNPMARAELLGLIK
jgi:GTP cyclohydrolase I